MRTAQTFTIILAIPDITNPFWPEVARGLQDVMAREGYAVVFANSDWDSQHEREFLRMARRNRFDGIVINPVTVTNAELLATHIPTVLVGAQARFSRFRQSSAQTASRPQKMLWHTCWSGPPAHRLTARTACRHTQPGPF